MFRRRAITSRLPRPVALGLALVVVALGLAVVPAPVLRLIEDYRVDREPLSFEAVAARGAQQDGGQADARTSEIVEADPFVTIGVRLPETAASGVSVRWRDHDGWSRWQELEVEVDKGPDRGTPEAASEAQAGGLATEPLWVGDADAYQVSVAGDPGSSAEVVLVRPDGARVAVETESVAGADALGKPAIRSRGEWGARGPSSSVGSAATLRLAVVHHSVTGNDYAPGDVPAILRSIQAYHMDSNGWSDIGYNFVVDRFGGIWEGRDGSLLRNSIGAHAEGFNTGSVGVVGLGNYSAGAPSEAQLSSITSVIAWRFAASGIDPATNVSFTSGGSSTIPAGTTVSLPRVIGHRNVGSTDCPGSNLYAAIASRIRPRLPELVRANSSPVGVVDIAAGGPRSILVSGWTLDPLVVEPIDVHLYLDGVGRNLGPTTIERPDLASTFPSSGTRHGYSALLGDVEPGPHDVCVFGINSGPGNNTLIECRRVVVETGNPFGVVEDVRAGPEGSIALVGWTIDPDRTSPADVHVYVDGQGTNLGGASIYRPDLTAAFPGYGGAHGFAWITTGLAPGPHEVCIFGINAGPGGNSLLGCRSVRVPGGPPVGVVDAVQTGPDGQVSLWGWVVDPDTAAPAEVHVYVDDQGYNLGRANGSRPDIAGAFPGYGAQHGYSWSGRTSPGSHRVCVFGIDTGGGGNTQLGCRTVTVPGGSPFGSIDGVSAAGGGRLSVVGWIIDPDTLSPVDAHVYIDGAGYNAGPANQSRPDVAAAKPPYGASHGLSWLSPPLAPGRHSVCVFGINVGAGANTLLNCRDVVV